MFSTRFFFIGRTPFCLAVIWILLNNIGDAIDIAWIRALFADFNKTFLCEGEHLCDSLKLSDCFSIRLVMLTRSLLSYEWVLIYRKLCIYIFSKLGCRHLEGDLRHWKLCHKSDIYHMPLVSCREGLVSLVVSSKAHNKNLYFHGMNCLAKFVNRVLSLRFLKMTM